MKNINLPICDQPDSVCSSLCVNDEINSPKLVYSLGAQSLFGIKNAVFLKPSAEIFQFRMRLSQLLNIRLAPYIMKPLEHDAEVLHHGQQGFYYEAESRWYRPSSLSLEDLGHLIEFEPVTSQGDTSISVLVGEHKGLRSEKANIADRDKWQRFFLHHILPAGSEDLTKEVWGEVVEECDRAENRPGHFSVFGLFDEMMLNAVFAHEMGNRRQTVKGSISTAINGRIHEMLDIVLEGCVDEVFALFLFGCLVGSTGDRDLM